MRSRAPKIAFLWCFGVSCAAPVQREAGAETAHPPSAPAAGNTRAAPLPVAAASPTINGEGAVARNELLPESDSVVEPGIRFRTFKTRQNQTIWVYTGEPPPPQPGLILIAPAGGSALLAATLGSGDTPEHVPYVAAGYTVVSYSLSGPRPSDSHNQEQVEAAMTAFIGSLGGAVDASAALDFALEQFPELDPKRVIAAGHSSAGSLALQLAASDPRIKGVIAYAPEPDPGADFTKKDMATLTEAIPFFPPFLKFVSPISRAAEIDVPVFLFHSKADDHVPTERIYRFATALRQHNSRLTLEEVEEGDHYESMIGPGIARGLLWLAKTYPPCNASVPPSCPPPHTTPKVTPAPSPAR